MSKGGRVFNPTTTRQAAQQNGLKVLVHGPAGAGKTRLCATTGDLERTLIISCEGGLLSLREFDIAVGEVSSFDELEEIYNYIANGQHNFSWICLDSVSEIAEVLLSAEKKVSKDARQAYGAVNDKMMGIFRAFRDLPMNVYFSAKQGEQELDGLTKLRPMMPGKTLTTNVPYLFDEVFAMHVALDQESGQLVRSLQTAKDHRFTAKDRSGALDMYEPANLGHVLNKIMGDLS